MYRHEFVQTLPIETEDDVKLAVARHAAEQFTIQYRVLLSLPTEVNVSDRSNTEASVASMYRSPMHLTGSNRESGRVIFAELMDKIGNVTTEGV